MPYGDIIAEKNGYQLIQDTDGDLIIDQDLSDKL